jgi:hypothetical protein
MNKLLIVGSLFLAGCATGPTTIILVHPTTAERVRCEFYSNPHPMAVLEDQRRTENCARQYEGLGFIRAENLTPQQKEIISKPTGTPK